LTEAKMKHNDQEMNDSTDWAVVTQQALEMGQSAVTKIAAATTDIRGGRDCYYFQGYILLFGGGSYLGRTQGGGEMGLGLREVVVVCTTSCRGICYNYDVYYLTGRKPSVCSTTLVR